MLVLIQMVVIQCMEVNACSILVITSLFTK